MENFVFLAKDAPELARPGQFAEHFFLFDPPASLIRTRQFAELTARDIVVRHGECSLLARAFRDEAVPQDPYGEPASVMPERIRAGLVAASKPKRGRRV